jgi:hypothetical protein
MDVMGVSDEAILLSRLAVAAARAEKESLKEWERMMGR